MIIFHNIILLFLHKRVFGHEFILKNERFKFNRTMFAKLFGVKAPFSSFHNKLSDVGTIATLECKIIVKMAHLISL